MSWILSAAVLSLISATSIYGQSAPYYGLPVGSFHYTRDGTKGDVYASDPRTLMVVNFKHQPKPGCTTYMVGPKDKENTTEARDRTAEGVMLPVRIRSNGPVTVSEPTVAYETPSAPTTVEPSVPSITTDTDQLTTTSVGSEESDATTNISELRRKKRNIGFMMSQIAALNAQLVNPFGGGNRQEGTFGELANLRLTEEEAAKNSHRDDLTEGGIDLDISENEENHGENEWIGPKLPPVATTQRSPVTRIRTLATKKMMPIGELMKMHEAKKAAGRSNSATGATTKVPSGQRQFPLNVETSAPVIRTVSEVRQNGNNNDNVMIVFNPEEGDEVQHRPQASSVSNSNSGSNGRSRRVSTTSRPSGRVTNRNRSNSGRRNRTTRRRNNNVQRTTRRPRNNNSNSNNGQRGGGPRRPHPGWEPKGWTPTLPYKRRGLFTRRPRTTAAPTSSQRRTRRPRRPRPDTTNRSNSSSRSAAATTTQRPPRVRSTPQTAVPTTPTGFPRRRVTSTSATAKATVSSASPSAQLSTTGTTIVEEELADVEINGGFRVVSRRTPSAASPTTATGSSFSSTPLPDEEGTTSQLPKEAELKATAVDDHLLNEEVKGSREDSKEAVANKPRDGGLNLNVRFFPAPSGIASVVYSDQKTAEEASQEQQAAAASRNAAIEQPQQLGPGIIMVDPDEKDAHVPQQVHSRFLRPLPRYPELYEPVENNDLVVHEAPIEFKTDVKSQTQTKEEELAVPVAGTTMDPSNWWVVPDPRTKKPKSETAGNSTRITTERPYSTPALPSPVFGGNGADTFALPDVDGETMLLELPEQYTINDFSWFGIYDHCKGLRTASVSLKEVTPPAEANVQGITGWQYETGSEEIVVINCNTILLRGFTFKGHRFSDSYIYVGTGEFPAGILQHVRAAVIGQSEEAPLRDYDNEDVIVRLPKNWKTFDVNFISVFNPTDRTSYGHAEIPPVVVPPCDDLF